MIESILSILGEIFLDILFTKSFNSQHSKKKQIVCIITLFIIFSIYFSIFILSLVIIVSSIYNDTLLALKMGIVTMTLFVIFFIYSFKIYDKLK